MNNWLLLFVCLGSMSIGWALGFFCHRKMTANKSSLNLSPDMKHRLQLLFDSYPDESIDRFIQSLEVTPETLPLHISIGKHFRTQGEVEKAILVHQNLMSHPELSSRASESIIYELAKDYKSAGLFDRAQALLHQLKGSKQFSVKSLKLLLDIHEAEKDWPTALNEATRVDLKKYKEIALRVAQYYCEVADKYSKEGLVIESVSNYRQALIVYKGCYRAHLGLAKCAYSRGDYNTSIYHLKLLIGIAPEHITLALPLLLDVTVKTGSFVSHQEYLKKLWADTGQIPVMLAIIDSMREEGCIKKAASFLFEYLQDNPSLTILNRFFMLNVLSDYSSKDLIQLMARILDGVQFNEQEFKCSSCGFSVRQLHWLCPSCKGWQTIKPVVEYEVTYQNKERLN